MERDDPRELEIIQSWHTNAAPWSNAIRNASIASRKLVTNEAIIDAVMSTAPASVLDVGCGEGWLARTLVERGIRATGVDAVPELIAHASSWANAATATPAHAAAEFFVQDYAAI